MEKKYVSEITNRSPRPRNKRLRNQGIGGAIKASSTVTVGSSGEYHTHLNKTTLDRISTDQDGYLLLSHTLEEDGEITEVIEKVKAGYADDAGKAAYALEAYGLVEDSPTAKLIRGFSDSFTPMTKDGDSILPTTWAEICDGTPLFAVQSLKSFYSEESIAAKGTPSFPGGITGVTALSALSDVELALPLAQGQALVYDGMKWVNQKVGIDASVLVTPAERNLWNQTADKADKNVKIIAGTGLAGGGSLAEDRTLSLATSGVMAGTYTKLTVDAYGRATAGASLVAADIPSLAISKITGLQNALDSKLDASVFNSMFEKVTENGVTSIKAKYSLWTEQSLAARGQAQGSGGTSVAGGGLIQNVYGWGSLGGAFDNNNLADTFNAYTVNKIWNDKADKSWVEGKGYLTSQSLANYLPLTGGTLTGTLNVTTGLGISDATGNGLIVYKPTSWTGVANTQWGVGTIDVQGVIRSSNTSLLHYRNGVGNSTIWDSYNDGAGSGLDADLLDGVHGDGYFRRYLSTNSGTSGASGWMDKLSQSVGVFYGHESNVGNIAWINTQYSQILFRDNNVIYYKTYHWNKGWGTWQQLACTTDNVASATKLQTTRQIWGQNFNGEGNVTGNLTLGSGYGIYGKDSINILKDHGNNNVTLCATSGDLFIGYDHTSNVRFYSGNTAGTGTEKMVLLANGNFGIGTTSPAEKCDINGNAYIRGNLRLKNSGSYGCKLNFGDGEYVYLHEDEDDHLTIHARAGISFDNDVTMAGACTVSGETQFDGDVYLGKNLVPVSGKTIQFGWSNRKIGGGYFGWICGAKNEDLYLGANAVSSIFIKANGYTGFGTASPAYTVDVNGVIHSNTGIFSDEYVSSRGDNSSDIRLKTDIRDFRATDILMALQPKQFRWNATARAKFKVFDTDEIQYGLIAQDVKPIAPWLVDEHMFGDEYWGVHYRKLIPVMHQGMREQVFRIDDLEIRVNDQESRVKRQESRIAELESENRELRRELEILKRR